MAVVIPGTAGNQPLVAWIVLPLGVLLPPGIAISVDGSEPERLPIRHCEPGGCLAPFELEDSILTRLRSGTELQVMAYGIDEQQVSFERPLGRVGAEDFRLVAQVLGEDDEQRLDGDVVGADQDACHVPTLGAAGLKPGRDCV